VTYPQWRGVFPAVTTQFHQDSSLDLNACARHWEALISSGVTGLIVAGSLGENQTLNFAEKRALVAEAVKIASGRVPVLSGVAELSTAAACEYVRDCERLGAAGFMVMPAMVYKADAAETMSHFRRVAAATSLPWMLYNNPVGYSVDVTPAQFAALADVPNLIAVKESSADTRRITELRIAVGDRFDSPIVGSRHRRLGRRIGHRLSARESVFLGTDPNRTVGRSAGDVPVVPPAVEVRHPRQVRPIHQAGRARSGPRPRMGS